MTQLYPVAVDELNLLFAVFLQQGKTCRHTEEKSIFPGLFHLVFKQTYENVIVPLNVKMPLQSRTITTS